MPLDQSDISELIRAAYRCSVDPDGWQRFVDALDAKLDSVYLSLYGHDTRTSIYLGALISKYDDYHLARYEAGLGERNPFLPVLAQANEMDMQPSEVWVERGDLEKTEFYADFLSPQEDIVAGGGGVIVNEADRMLILSGQVRRQDEDHKVDELIATLRILAPHVREAFQISREFGGRGLRCQTHFDVFDQLSQAVLLLDETGRICDRNMVAEDLLRSGDIAAVDPAGFLRLVDGEAQKSISACLARYRAGADCIARDCGALRSRNGGRHAYRLVPVSPEDTPALPLRGFAPAGAPVAMLVVRGVKPLDAEALDGLRTAFGATPSEMRMAGHLLDGLSVAEDAAARGVTVNTARKQLKSLYQKTGTSRQGELIALLARVLG